jgi:hypothetical protein
VSLNRACVAVFCVSVVLAGTGAAHADPTKDECIEADESAQALRTQARLREAEERLSLCVASTCPAPVRNDCTERLNEVQKAVPTVVFDVRSSSGDAIGAARVRMDGAVLAGKLDGTAVAVDPGKHAFAFEADGYAPLEVPFTVLEGGKLQRVDAVMSSAAHRTPVARSVSYVALGVGAVGVVVGGVFGFRAMLDKAALDGACMGGACPARSQHDIDALRADGTVSNIGFEVGLPALAAGVVLWLLSAGPEKAPAPAAVWVGPRAAGVAGRF